MVILKVKTVYSTNVLLLIFFSSKTKLGLDIVFPENAEFNDYIIIVATTKIFLTFYLNLNIRFNVCINIKSK